MRWYRSRRARLCRHSAERSDLHYTQFLHGVSSKHTRTPLKQKYLGRGHRCKNMNARVKRYAPVFKISGSVYLTACGESATYTPVLPGVVAVQRETSRSVM